MSIKQRIDQTALFKSLRSLVGQTNVFPVQTGVRTWTAKPLLDWAAYTPTVTAGVGTLTTVSATGRWAQINKVVIFEAVITLTTNGTGSSFLNCTLPTTANSKTIFAGRETAIAGHMLSGTVAAASNTAAIVQYDGTYPGANGASITLSGSYETQ